MKRLRPFLILLIVAALAAGGYWLYRTRLAPPAAQAPLTQVATVERGDVLETINVSGTLEATRKKTLRFEKSRPATPLKSLLVKTGDVVSQGDVLATIDPTFYEQALEQARVNLRAAEERLAKLNQPPAELDRSKAALGVAKADLQLATAEEELASALKPDLAALRAKVAEAEKTLAEKQKALQAVEADKTHADALREAKERELAAGAEQARLAAETYTDVFHQDRLRLARNEFADATDARIALETGQAIKLLGGRLAVRQAERTAGDARRALAEAQKPPGASDERRQAIVRAELAVREARLAQQQASEAVERLDRGPDALEVAAIEAEIEQLRMEVESAGEALEQTRLVAPFDGTVLETAIPVGGAVGPAVGVLTLADVTDLQVTGWVDELRVRRLAAGQPAQVTFEALPFETFSARVKSVPLQPVVENQVRIYRVPIALDDPAGLPRQMGISANIVIGVGEALGVIVVPAMAVEEDGPDYIVLVPPPGGVGEPVPVQVEVGLSDGINTEIRSGLEEGDEVIIPLEGAPEAQFISRLRPAVEAT